MMLAEGGTEDPKRPLIVRAGSRVIANHVKVITK
jgi:hypothetical protein